MLLLFFGCNSAEGKYEEQKVNEFKEIKLPIYKTASAIKEDFNKKYLVKYVKYSVEMYYPAKDIIEFYDKEMAKMSFEPFVEDYFKDRYRSWNTYEDGTLEGEPGVTACEMSWVSKDQTKRATLVLKYFWWKKEKRRVLNSNSKLKVEFRIQPFYLEPPQS